MTTLLNQLNALPGTCGVSLDGPTGTPGDVLSTITIDGEVMTVVMGIGGADFIVDRGADPAVHVVGATVSYTAGTPFGSASLASYTAAGDIQMHAAVGESGNTGSQIYLFAANNNRGGNVQLEGGQTIGANQTAQFLVRGGNDDDNIGGGIVLLAGDGGGTDSWGGGIELTLGAKTGTGTPGQFVIDNLPTADPHIVGAVWSNTGTLKISAG